MTLYLADTPALDYLASYHCLNHSIPCWMRPEIRISGTEVKRYKDTIFIPLPRELWRECIGGCACDFCSADGKSNQPAYWDTLAVAKNAPSAGHNDYVWTVHYPELHGARSKRMVA